MATVKKPFFFVKYVCGIIFRDDDVFKVSNEYTLIIELKFVLILIEHIH